MAPITPFNIHPQDGLDRATGYFFATLCRAGYLPDPGQVLAVGMIGGANAMNFYFNRSFTVPENYLLVWPDHSCVWLINGTTNPLQYLTAYLGATRAVYPGNPGQANSFFGNAFLQIVPPVLNDLIGLAPPNLTIIGHSLGGAVASIAALTLRAPFNVPGVWTIGQPRTGDLLWAQSYPLPYERITNQGDPVPLLPPSTNTALDEAYWPYFQPVPFSYRHAGTRHYLLIGGGVTQVAEMSSWEEGFDLAYDALALGNIIATGHDTPEYARRIRAGIPVPFKTFDPFWPGLDQLDGFNFIYNAGADWSFFAPSIQQSPQPPARGPFAIQGVC